MPLTRTTMVGLIWASVAILVWSGSLVMLRLGVTTSLNAYDLTMLRFGVAAVILAPVMLKRGTARLRLGWWAALAMVASFGAPYIILLSIAMKTAPAAAAGALNPGVMAIASVLLGAVVFHDRISTACKVGLGVTAAGIAGFTWAGGALTSGHMILVGTGVMWALYALIVRQKAVPALNATAIVAVGSAIIYAPLYAVALPKSIFAAPLTDILMQAVFQGVFVSVAAVYAFNRSAECLGPVVGATLPALIPVVTLGLGVLALDETVSLGELSSAALVTVGLALILVGGPVIRWFRTHLSNRSGHRWFHSG